MANFMEIIKKLNEEYEIALDKNSGEAYGKLSTMFEELGAYLREHVQTLMVKDMKRIIQQLESGKIITGEDKEKIKLWIVGDAEYYAKLENNFDDWKAELGRLMGEINRIKTDEPDTAAASKLRGLLRDGSRVLADMFYFAQQKDRVEQFNESIRDIDDAEREILVRLLKQKIKSPEM